MGEKRCHQNSSLKSQPSETASSTLQDSFKSFVMSSLRRKSPSKMPKTNVPKDPRKPQTSTAKKSEAKRKLEKDLVQCADDVINYNARPVKGFGEAMLSRMSELSEEAENETRKRKSARLAASSRVPKTTLNAFHGSGLGLGAKPVHHREVTHLAIGDNVAIKKGPFKGQSALIVAFLDPERVIVRVKRWQTIKICLSNVTLQK